MNMRKKDADVIVADSWSEMMAISLRRQQEDVADKVVVDEGLKQLYTLAMRSKANAELCARLMKGPFAMVSMPDSELNSQATPHSEANSGDSPTDIAFRTVDGEAPSRTPSRTPSRGPSSQGPSTP